MLGCAILAAVAAGHYPDVPTAAAAMVSVERVVQPDPAAAPLYEEPYRKYCKLYGALVDTGVGRSHTTAPTHSNGHHSQDKDKDNDKDKDGRGVKRKHDAGDAGTAWPSGSGITIAPSILAADFADLGSAVSDVVAGGAHWVHVDMFDGTYCPNWTIGPPVVASLRKRSPRGEAFLDCHLAVQVGGMLIIHCMVLLPPPSLGPRLQCLELLCS